MNDADKPIAGDGRVGAEFGTQHFNSEGDAAATDVRAPLTAVAGNFG
jgi:hypothetical protein